MWPSALPDPGPQRPAPSAKMVCWQAFAVDRQVCMVGRNTRGAFLKERSLNVIENKGPLWKTPERSWNVWENKGT
jgi:hypothetical protein